MCVHLLEQVSYLLTRLELSRGGRTLLLHFSLLRRRFICGLVACLGGSVFIGEAVAVRLGCLLCGHPSSASTTGLHSRVELVGGSCRFTHGLVRVADLEIEQT